MILQRGMDHMALISVHRFERDVAAVARDLACNLLRKALQCLLALEAVAFGIDIDAHTLVLAAVDGIVGQMLDCVERLAAAANEDAKVFTHEINQIRLVRRLDGVRHGVGAHVLKEALDEGFNALFRGAGLCGRVDLRFCRDSGLFGLLRLARLLVAAFGLRAALLLRCAFLTRLLRSLGCGSARILRTGRFGRSRCDDLWSGGRDHLRTVRGLGLSRLFRLAARRGRQGGLGRFIGCFIGDLDARGLCADAKETGSRVFQNFDRNAVTIHMQFFQSRCNGQVDRFAGCGNKFLHNYSSVCSASEPAERFLP